MEGGSSLEELVDGVDIRHGKLGALLGPEPEPEGGGGEGADSDRAAAARGPLRIHIEGDWGGLSERGLGEIFEVRIGGGR